MITSFSRYVDVEPFVQNKGRSSQAPRIWTVRCEIAVQCDTGRWSLAHRQEDFSTSVTGAGENVLLMGSLMRVRLLLQMEATERGAPLASLRRQRLPVIVELEWSGHRRFETGRGQGRRYLSKNFRDARHDVRIFGSFLQRLQRCAYKGL